jgi:hypothetical protein
MTQQRLSRREHSTVATTTGYGSVITGWCTSLSMT